MRAMIFFAAAFTFLFALGFVYSVFTALSTGTLRGIGWRWTRSDQPIMYWFGIGAWSFVAIVASLFTLVMAMIGFADPDGPISTNAGKLTQAQANTIADKCGAPRKMLVIDDGKLTMLPKGELSKIGCLLDAINATGEASFPSVGNQLHQAATDR